MAVVKVGGWDNAWPPWSTWKVDALQHALLLKSPKKSICVYGASTSGSTLCGSPAANGRGRITLDLALIRLRTTPETETELGALRAAPSWPPADVETPSTPSRTGSSRPSVTWGPFRPQCPARAGAAGAAGVLPPLDCRARGPRRFSSSQRACPPAI